jgi:hypothetical protein
MPSYGEHGRGIADLAVYVLNPTTEVPGAKVDVPGARGLTWSTDSDSEPLEGDDKVLNNAYSPKTGSGNMATAGANLTAMGAMLGMAVVVTGTPETATMEETSAPNVTNIQIKGQQTAIDTPGSASEVHIAKAKVGGIDEGMELNTWRIPSIDFTFVQAANGKFITRKHYTTMVPLA